MPTPSYILFFAAILWCLVWSFRATRSINFVLLLVGTGAIHTLLAARGLYTNTTALPPPQVLLIAPAILALLLCVVVPRGRKWLISLPLFALTAVHLLRIPVELVLHTANEVGQVPRDMTYSGFNFDILSGISAAFVVVWLRSKRGQSRGVLIAWNIVCLVLLFIVVGTAVLSIPSSVQRINFERPNVLVTAVPWVLLPALLVPVVLWAHVAALVQLLGGKSRATA